MMSEGQVDEARASEFFGNALTKTAAAVRRDNPRIVFFGEAVAWLWAEGKIDSVLRLEQMWNPRQTRLRCAVPIPSGLSSIREMPNISGRSAKRIPQ